MQQYNCIIVDDEPFARNLIADYIAQIPQIKCIGSCKNAFELQTLLLQQEADLILLDIELPSLSGIQFLKNVTVKPKVIFITAHRDYALEAFELDVVDYLLKPVSLERFVKAIDRFLKVSDSTGNHHYKENEGRSDHVFINVNRSMRKVHLRDILYIEAKGDYLKFAMNAENPLLTKMTLTSLNQYLSNKFIRIHRSFVINLDHLTAYTSERVCISENTWLTIGRKYKECFKKQVGSH